MGTLNTHPHKHTHTHTHTHPHTLTHTHNNNNNNNNKITEKTWQCAPHPSPLRSISPFTDNRQRERERERESCYIWKQQKRMIQLIMCSLCLSLHKGWRVLAKSVFIADGGIIFFFVFLQKYWRKWAVIYENSEKDDPAYNTFVVFILPRSWASSGEISICSGKQHHFLGCFPLKLSNCLSAKPISTWSKRTVLHSVVFPSYKKKKCSVRIVCVFCLYWCCFHLGNICLCIAASKRIVSYRWKEPAFPKTPVTQRIEQSRNWGFSFKTLRWLNVE